MTHGKMAALAALCVCLAAGASGCRFGEVEDGATAEGGAEPQPAEGEGEGEPEPEPAEGEGEGEPEMPGVGTNGGACYPNGTCLSGFFCGMESRCVADSDGDRVPDEQDNCPEERGVRSNRGCPEPEPAEGEGEGEGEPEVPSAGAEGGACYANGTCNGPFVCRQGMCVPNPDSDGDGVDDEVDNCPAEPNADQEDLDEDGSGDACDADVDGDRIANRVDTCPRIANPDNNSSACADPVDCARDAQCDDGNSCTVDICGQDGACLHATVACDDGIACTEDLCIPATGCRHEPADDACEDGETCVARIFDFLPAGCFECLPELGLECDDGDPCTTDRCTEGHTCQSEPFCGEDEQCVVLRGRGGHDLARCTEDRDGDGHFWPYDPEDPEDEGAVDCNDGDSRVYPGAVDICDYRDNDCDGVVDNGFRRGGCSAGNGECRRTGSWECLPNGGQMCLDPAGAPLVPAAPQAEVCGDGLDNDCDDATDEEAECPPDEDPADGGEPAPNGGTERTVMCVPEVVGSWTVNLWGATNGAGGARTVEVSADDGREGACWEQDTRESDRSALRFNAQKPDGSWCGGWVNDPADLRNLCPGFTVTQGGVRRTLQVVSEASRVNYRIE